MDLRQQTALYALLGVMYGGDGKTTFGLPNLRGQMPIGVGVAPSTGTNYALAKAYGQEQVALTAANMPSHNHTATFTPTFQNQTVSIPAVPSTLTVSSSLTALQTGGTVVPKDGFQVGQGGGGSGAAPIYVDPTTASPTVGKAALGGVSVSATGSPATAATSVNVTMVNGGAVSVTAAGSAGGLSVLQPSLALNFILATLGSFPIRPS
jgi:microcystin-dependent protein